MNRNTTLAIFIVICSVTYCYAQKIPRETCLRGESVILFKASKHIIDPAYKDNTNALKSLDSLVWKLDKRLIDTLYIVSCTSPDGQIVFNEQLGVKRANSIAEYLKEKYPTSDLNRILISSKNHEWSELTDQLMKDSTFTYKTEFEKIVEYTNNPNQFAFTLKKVDQGRCYQYIADNYLIFQRNATAYHKNSKLVIGLSTLVVPTISEYKDAGNNISSMNRIQQELYRWRYPFALKTNLLLDALTAVNVEIEVPVVKQWSVNVGYFFPWWNLRKEKIALHILYGYAEGRYWFSKRSRSSYYYHSLNGEVNSLQGWYAGAYIGKGIYDLLWKSEGVKGDIRWSAGFSFGYVHPLNRHFALEFGTNIGYVDTDYERFVPKGECLLWKSDESVKWFGITQAKISLVWRPGFKQKIRP